MTEVIFAGYIWHIFLMLLFGILPGGNVAIGLELTNWLLPEIKILHKLTLFAIIVANLFVYLPYKWFSNCFLNP